MFLFLVCFVVFFCQRFQMPWPYRMWPVLFSHSCPGVDHVLTLMLIFFLISSWFSHLQMFRGYVRVVSFMWACFPLLHTRCLSPGSLLLGKTLFCLWEVLVILSVQSPFIWLQHSAFLLQALSVPASMCLVNLLIWVLLGPQLSYPRSGKRMTWVRPMRLSPGSSVSSGNTHRSGRSWVILLSSVRSWLKFLELLFSCPSWGLLIKIFLQSLLLLFCVYFFRVSFSCLQAKNLIVYKVSFPLMVFSALCCTVSK